MVLVESSPAMVTTETLLERVWPGLVVNPETVSQRVKLLRGALGDDPRQPRYIVVVRGRGYRLASPVVQLVPAAATTSPEPVRRWRVLPAVVIALAVLTGAVLLWLLRDPSLPAQVGPVDAAERRSIAVRPFQAVGTAPDDENLARGLAETVLHQLSVLGDVSVTARSSSFSPEIARMDARSAGLSLHVAYLLEGTVQRVGSQLRITVHLIDAGKGKQVESLKFDRSTRDILAVQDEIAFKVVQALELSLDAEATRRISDLGTEDGDAWWEFVQASGLLALGRVGDLAEARRHLQRAIDLDPDFALAYVELGTVELREAEFAPQGDRRARFEAAMQRAGQRFEQAIAIDPDNGPAHLGRAYLLAFTDLAAAEREYRLGLSMAPNDAAGHEGLAAVLYQDPLRHDEALDLLDRARRIDPMQLRYDITKSGLLFHARGDVAGAMALVRGVLQKNSLYAPALSRMASLVTNQGQLAQGVQYAEQALKHDPASEWSRRQLICLYLDLGDVGSARAVLRDAPGNVPIRELALLLQGEQWKAAGELAYEALDTDAAISFDEPGLALALRRHARATGEIKEAQAALASLADLRWRSDDEPTFPEYTDLRLYVAGAADLLFLSGQEQKGRHVLQRLIAQIDLARREQRRNGFWTHLARAQALTLLSDPAGAVQALHDALADHMLPHKYHAVVELDPIFDALRGRADYQAFQAEMVSQIRSQKAELTRMREAGLVPMR